MLYVVGNTSKIFSSYLKTRKLKKRFLSIGRSNADNYLDFENPDMLTILNSLLKKFKKNDTFLFLLSISSPEECNNDILKSTLVNVVNTYYFIKGILDTGANFFFISSDTVFEGSNKKNTEYSDHSTLHAYGTQKSIIEKTFFRYDNFKILRFSQVIQQNDPLILKLIKDKKIDMYNNFYRNVVIEDDIHFILKLVETNQNKLPKILNCCGNICYSKRELFRKVDKFKYEINFRNAPKSFFKCRSQKIIMQSDLFKKVLGRDPIDPTEWIRDKLN